MFGYVTWINLWPYCITVNNFNWAIWTASKNICHVRWQVLITYTNFSWLINILSLLRSNISRLQNLRFFWSTLLLLFQSCHDLTLFSKRRFLVLKYGLLLYLLSFLPIWTTIIYFSRLCAHDHQNCKKDWKNGCYYANADENISFTLAWLLRLVPPLPQ